MERCFHIYYNPSKQAAERERMEQRIEKLRQFMDRHIGKDEKFGKTENSLVQMNGQTLLNGSCNYVGVYFDCAEPTARMLRASLAEDESHLHGRLSQVKFDNTSVC